MSKDSLGDRIKSQYEDRTRFFLPRRTYTIIRVDGKAFHTFTRDFLKPFDANLMNWMDNTAIGMCGDIQGACFAYVQSDEISILLTDFAKPTTSAWFDGNVQKMASIAAATATMHFNKQLRSIISNQDSMPIFDARVFTIPDPIEVQNYFIWRQQDAVRNSVQMATRAVYSHKECENKNIQAMHDMLFQKGINWDKYSCGEKRGRCIVKINVDVANNYKGSLEGQAAAPDLVNRSHWVCFDGKTNQALMMDNKETPIFTQDRAFLKGLIPKLNEEKYGLEAR